MGVVRDDIVLNLQKQGLAAGTVLGAIIGSARSREGHRVGDAARGAAIGAGTHLSANLGALAAGIPTALLVRALEDRGYISNGVGSGLLLGSSGAGALGGGIAGYKGMRSLMWPSNRNEVVDDDGARER